MTQHFVKHAEWPIKLDGIYDCVFMDPPDNIKKNYKDDDTKDHIDPDDYESKMFTWLAAGLNSMNLSGTMWVSFNAQHTFMMSRVCEDLFIHFDINIRPMVQTFTFGQHNSFDFGNNYRPLWRFQMPNAKVYTEQIRCESERQKQGDKRADPRGKVPGDSFSFPRVVGNSKQRRNWHPTQLNEGLVERCIKSCTIKDDWVLDVFSGTGTTLRVCKAISRKSISIESSLHYCTMIAAEHDLEVL